MGPRDDMMVGRETVVMEGEDMECEEEMELRDQYASLIIHGKYGREPELLYLDSGGCDCNSRRTNSSMFSNSRTNSSSSSLSERESMLEEAWERRKRHSMQYLPSDDDRECQMELVSATAAMMMISGDNHNPYPNHQRRGPSERVMGRSVSCCGPREGGRGGQSMELENMETMDGKPHAMNSNSLYAGRSGSYGGGRACTQRSQSKGDRDIDDKAGDGTIRRSPVMKRSCSSASVKKTKKLMRSLTDDDFEELRGCLDLGLISYINYDDHSSNMSMAVDDDGGGDDDEDDDEARQLCHTLPALQLCYCIALQSHQLQQQQQQQQSNIPSPRSSSMPSSASSTPSLSPQASSVSSTWKIANPGDDPQDVKERLRHWAQAVACNLRLCKSGESYSF